MDFERFDVQQGIAGIKLSGSLDVSGAASVESAVHDAGRSAPYLIVDLAEVSFLSSQGVRILVATAKSLAGRKGKLILCSPIPSVEKVLKTIGATEIIPIAGSRQQAASLAASFQSGK